MVGSVASQIGKPAFQKFVDSGGNPLKNLAMRSSRGDEAPASDGAEGTDYDPKRLFGQLAKTK
jgi:hypothetical protein